MTGEVVGVYYNKAKLKKLGLKLPTTFQQFEAAVAKAQAAGETPIQFGNLDKWPGIHEFEELMLQNVTQGRARATGSSARAAARSNFNIARHARRGDEAAELGEGGRVHEGLRRVSATTRRGRDFGKGKGVFLISGSWLTADLKKALGKDLGFFLLPPPSGKPLATLGGEGLPWAISSKSKNADAAATYLDFITNNASMQVVTDNGQPLGDEGEGQGAGRHRHRGLQRLERRRTRRTRSSRTSTGRRRRCTTRSRPRSRSCWRARSTPQAFANKVNSDYSKFHSG